jgi:hypothetical protein
MPVTTTQPLTERALEVLRRTGNPFRNYFARNPDDEVCARFHVPELFATERDQLLGVVGLYRDAASVHSEIVPVLGSKGAGKTHLLHSIKHAHNAPWQLLVTPRTYHKDSEFLEYLLFQIIDTLLGGGKQKGNRPLDVVGEELARRLLRSALQDLTPTARLDLFPSPGLGGWVRRFGLGSTQAQERAQWMLDHLSRMDVLGGTAGRRLCRLCGEVGVDPKKACDAVAVYIERTEPHSTFGLMRRHILEDFVRAILLGDESELAGFLTYGFAELEFSVRPTRQDLVLALFKALMDVFRDLRIPVVVAFDQLEDLLLARRTEDGHRVAEAFFAGIVQAMHQVDGICFLVFAERGLWNRFVPSLDGYIQDRLNNSVHVPRHGTIKTLRLEAPALELVQAIVAARLRPALEELPDFADLPPAFPFTDEQVTRVARTEPTLRDMLQQFRHLFEHIVYGTTRHSTVSEPRSHRSRLPDSEMPPAIKSIMVVETPAHGAECDVPEVSDVLALPSARPLLLDLWEQESRAARRKLEPEGAVTGATRELQAGLGKFLQVCHEHGAKVGPWRLHHVVGEIAFGDHPTYGVLSIAHWTCRESQPWKVGVGLFLGRGPGKPKDLEIKLAAMETDPSIDHLILLRPEDDLTLSGKSKSLWHEAERRGRHARLEALSLDEFAALYAFPRWLAALAEALPDGQPIPNLADFLQQHCESLLERVCMPVQQ